MQRTRDDFFSTASFTRNDDCRRALRDALNLGHEVADYGTVEYGRDPKEDLCFRQIGHMTHFTLT